MADVPFPHHDLTIQRFRLGFKNETERARYDSRFWLDNTTPELFLGWLQQHLQRFIVRRQYLELEQGQLYLEHFKTEDQGSALQIVIPGTLVVRDEKFPLITYSHPISVLMAFWVMQVRQQPSRVEVLGECFTRYIVDCNAQILQDAGQCWPEMGISTEITPLLPIYLVESDSGLEGTRPQREGSGAPRKEDFDEAAQQIRDGADYELAYDEWYKQNGKRFFVQANARNSFNKAMALRNVDRSDYRRVS